MITRMTSRSAACLLALALFGAFAVTSIRQDTASQEMAAASQEAAALAATGMDISALTAESGTAHLPVLTIRDPI